MTRNLHPTLLCFVVLLLSAIQMATVLVALDASRDSAYAAMDATLASGERVVNRLLQDYSERLAVSADLAAANPALERRIVAREALAGLDASIPGTFALLTDADGVPLVQTTRAPYPADENAFADILRRATSLGRTEFIAVYTNSAVLMAVRPVAGSAYGRQIVHGTVIDQGLVDSMARSSGLTVTLLGKVSGEPGTVLAKSGKNDGSLKSDHQRTRQMSFAGVDREVLQAELGLPISRGLREHRAFRMKVLIASFVAVLIGSLLMTGVAGMWLAARFTDPIQDVIAAVARIENGVYTKPAPVLRRDQVGRLARAVNDMQKEIAEREGRIVHHAQYDALTGLTNRSVVSDKLKLAVSRAQRSGASVAAMSVDLSRFNEVNDTMGHEVGDMVLKEVARRLASNTRVSDTVARVGGDEFFVIVEDVDERLASHMAEFLASALQTPIVIDGNQVHLRSHIGMAIYPKHCESPDALRRLANVALSAAKENSSEVLVYEPGQDERHLRELAITHDLPNALKSEEFYLQYQPKIDIETQQVEHVEALVRWKHPQLGFIPPDEFIGVLESSGRINLLTDWVLRTVVQQIRRWHSHGYPLSVAVNLSVRDLMDETLPERITSLLRHFVVEPSSLSVEITESAVMQDPERAIRVLNELHKAGIKIALDDFGTGQTSLALLKKLPIDELKIDKSFVQNLRTDSGDAIIVKSTIDLGHNMGLLVVAEGVENNYGWNLLKSYGCDLIQGYLISRPLAACDMEEWYLRLQARHVNKLDLAALVNA